MCWFLNPVRKWWKSRVERQLLKDLKNERAEESLKLLLKLMSLSYKLNKEFQKNITGFKGKYQFRTVDNSIKVAAVFNGNNMKVKNGLIKNPDVSVVFKDGQALTNYLMSQLISYLRGKPPDITEMLLHNKVTLKGNINYMMKFAYMANHLQLALTGGLP